ncbi:ATP-grasp fold amidoligase family protein [Ureibacillus aquaedulcis]|uniref:ATP-grasp fold amidoligase family protein n=1 Tax=Ureibacillus aquaedulcis TaxID=3058421 RepID=A0ABT8GUL1_9BACL|nr:ATP-grasp fold amidoligase family protein [Ureibacillus sp. BA0131]MDN4495100.1 ATP-grasp fold amidoligase family protein [Ureibacillus sp. BA0131]
MSIKSKVLRFCFSLLVKFSPKLASEVIYYKTFKKKLDLKNPKTINEKLMWLKLNEDDSLKAKCADKYLVREYINEKGFSKILNDLIKVYDNVEELDFNQLPNQFVIKCTHGSGFNIICTDKKNLDLNRTKAQLKKWMKTNYSLISCEPHYARHKPKIVVERYLERDHKVNSPMDIQFHCFHGEPRLIEVILNNCNQEEDYILYNLDWENLPYNDASLNLKTTIDKPSKLDEMIEITKVLSQEFTYVRVDLYFSFDKIYFGELTFTPDACLATYYINNADYKVGRLLELPSISKKQSLKSTVH